MGVPLVISRVNPSRTYIMPSVAMKAGTRRKAITQPIRASIQAPPAIAATKASQVGQPKLTASIALAQPARAAREPLLKSNSPPHTTIAAPMAHTPVTHICRIKLIRLDAVRKVSPVVTDKNRNKSTRIAQIPSLSKKALHVCMAEFFVLFIGPRLQLHIQK